MPRRNPNDFVVRYKNGQGILARHCENSSLSNAIAYTKRHGRVLSIKKVRPSEIIGTIETMSLENIVFGQKPEPVEKNPMLAERTLEDVVFSKKKSRRFNGKREESRRDTRGEFKQ